MTGCLRLSRILSLPSVTIPPMREVSVTQCKPVSVTRNKGGRPRKENPLTPAERQRRRRERLKEAKCGMTAGRS